VNTRYEEDDPLERTDGVAHAPPEPVLEVDRRDVPAEEELLELQLGQGIRDRMGDVRETAKLGVEDDQQREGHEVGEEAPRPTDHDRREQQDQDEAIRGQREADQKQADGERGDERGDGRDQAAARKVRDWWAPALLAAGAALLAVGARLPFVNAPLTADEGGYAEVARLWERGGVLYRDVWVDRPQGLVLAYRLVVDVGGSPAVIRALAAVVAGLVVLVVMRLGIELGGRIVGSAAAVLLATVGSSPFVESFTLAGELLATLPATVALLAFVRYLRDGRAAWLLAAGVLAGSALMVKQSAVDALVAVLATLLWTRRRGGIAPALLVLAAAAAPVVIGVLAAHDTTDWWDAVVGYRGQGDSILTGPAGHRLDQFLDTLPAAAAGLGLLAVFAAAGWTRAPFLARAWVAAAALGVLGGGNFHAHYYLQLAPPLALLAGFGVHRLYETRSRVLGAVAAATAVATIAVTLPLWVEDGAAQAGDVWPNDPHLASDRAVADYVRAHTRPGQPIQVVWAAAGIYYLADRPPALRYMWRRPIESVPGALTEARRVLAAREPALVVLAQPPSAVDPSGRTARILRTRYRLDAVVAGVPVLAPLRD
jgi:4-amino-4-deoxy-L-arabinose transferase-like glycosyltransferase